MNRVIISGNLTRDPELRYTPAGTAVCDFGLAINERWKDADGQQQERAHFIEITAWRGTAEIAAEYLHKGSKCLVDGKLIQDRWETKEGAKRSRVKIEAFWLEFMDGRKSQEGEGSRPKSASEERLADGTDFDMPEEEVPF